MTTLMKSQKADIVRLGVELQYRRCRVWEHPLFGGVKKSAHIKNSKHLTARAIDVNREHLGQRAEDNFFDVLSGELYNRRFGRIWNRGPGDHQYHLHAETIVSLSENYLGRVNRKRSIQLPRLKVDGILGPGTMVGLQRWIGTPMTGAISERGSTFTKALQAYLNTETRGGLVIDGIWGEKTTRSLQGVLGTPVDGVISGQSSRNQFPIRGFQMRSSATGSTMIANLQNRLNTKGHIA